MIRQIKILKVCKILDRTLNETKENIKILAIYNDDDTINYIDMMNRINLKNINVLDYKKEIELYTDSELCSQWI
jgi:hypothetical protein